MSVRCQATLAGVVQPSSQTFRLQKSHSSHVELDVEQVPGAKQQGQRERAPHAAALLLRLRCCCCHDCGRQGRRAAAAVGPSGGGGGGDRGQSHCPCTHSGWPTNVSVRTCRLLRRRLGHRHGPAAAAAGAAEARGPQQLRIAL